MRFFEPSDDPLAMRSPLRHCPELIEAIQAEFDCEPLSILDRPGDISLAKRNYDRPLVLTAKAA